MNDNGKSDFGNEFGGLLPPPPPQRGERRALKHGLITMKRALSALGSRAIDGRFKVSKELAKWRRDLIEDLGGEENISVQQQTLADLCVKSKLMLDSVDSWILTQKTLIVARRKSLLPVVLQRQQLADGLARYLNQLGLSKRQRVRTLDDILTDGEDK
jgi:hypothetical protein